MNTDTDLEEWLEAQYHHCAHQMLRGISATDIIKQRPGFGQSIQAHIGSVVASPVLAAYDPDPDYFFHWYRDSAVVMDALRILYERGTLSDEALQLFEQFVHFSLAADALDGRALVERPQWRERVQPDFVKFLRQDADLAQAHGERIRGETRLNADGSLDISSWPRPQHDGIATRALTLTRWLKLPGLEPAVREAASRLLQADVHYTRRHWREPSYDIWEEDLGLHYYTLCTAAAALADDPAGASILRMLDGFWDSSCGHYRSRVLSSGAASTKQLDIAVILAAVHTDLPGVRHSPGDPRQHATLTRLEELFARQYLINEGRPVGSGPAMGRYAGDVYYSGGAYYFSTLGAAELCYLAAVRMAPDAAQPWLARGDAFLETVRAFTPASGDLAEQFDQKTGVQSSARDLTWSYAAFISATAARRRALQAENVTKS
ncbi:MAG TPA: glycoside hydrolase family 15 protein [Steroidobacteraceae bacterium]|nr:glycoside hydrolase family 15 protein [Steroidobacteraceae bacterium]